MKASFDAIVDGRTRIVILGSLPGEASLARQQYYARPTNQFWRLIGGVIERDLVALDYERRLAALRAAGIGLWDVIGTARRTGSSDSAIRDHTARDLQSFAAGLDSLRALAFNGAKAAAIGRRQLAHGDALFLLDLPSSSAAYCAVSFAQKLEQWLRIRDFLN
ncbi:DNA-deoxyinosine glycosylase [Novosphingobium album (ex Liu et al. 2023)]|uniref:DNA-deoxyinosine glycosylase n=1 Tax=Novosphingobium album (ex Liu et al. 2023) TaxID=3031130 RepID=A0ABT5WSR7_9SPHN|nr:DNA-deoxyinosine glycosylase [Novosphingobium album (ex Liu et al. 2023)]MDE8653086.1 DNA-deoxyinosine glycosylase [Novosphingobium album (ex Liu et al. 2023)]